MNKNSIYFFCIFLIKLIGMIFIKYIFEHIHLVVYMYKENVCIFALVGTGESYH